eukprot:12777995-Prorocentrum_lima.AAC.1
MSGLGAESSLRSLFGCHGNHPVMSNLSETSVVNDHRTFHHHNEHLHCQCLEGDLADSHVSL